MKIFCFAVLAVLLMATAPAVAQYPDWWRPDGIHQHHRYGYTPPSYTPALWYAWPDRRVDFSGPAAPIPYGREAAPVGTIIELNGYVHVIGPDGRMHQQR
jgi:hypothetical protein